MGLISAMNIYTHVRTVDNGTYVCVCIFDKKKKDNDVLFFEATHIFIYNSETIYERVTFCRHFKLYALNIIDE